ncbi:MAG: hypothetical protein WC575_03755 [Patescibacteria group bacterium]
MIYSENEFSGLGLEEQVKKINESFDALPEEKGEELAKLIEMVEGTGLVIKNIEIEFDHIFNYINAKKDYKLDNKIQKQYIDLLKELEELHHQYSDLKVNKENNERRYSPILMGLFIIKRQLKEFFDRYEHKDDHSSN